MINNEEFIVRLKKVMSSYNESASSFAEKIGVQRSSISHILSGRNKPSLEFVLKVLAAFPEVDLYWLMNGTGVFPLETKKENLVLHSESENSFIATKSKTANPEIHKSIKSYTSDKKEIDRIIIFYKDGSFSNFEN